MHTRFNSKEWGFGEYFFDYGSHQSRNSRPVTLNSCINFFKLAFAGIANTPVSYLCDNLPKCDQGFGIQFILLTIRLSDLNLKRTNSARI